MRDVDMGLSSHRCCIVTYKKRADMELTVNTTLCILLKYEMLAWFARFQNYIYAVVRISPLINAIAFDTWESLVPLMNKSNNTKLLLLYSYWNQISHVRSYFCLSLVGCYPSMNLILELRIKFRNSFDLV